MAIIPDFLVKSQSQTLDGRRWLERLPVLIDEISNLWELQQDEIICSTLKQLWQVSTEAALAVGIRDLGVMLDYWCKDIKLKYLGSPYADHVEKGCLIYQSMHRSTVHKSLLVTDLHAGNILSSTRSPWLMIDPKPFVGDPAYDLLSVTSDQWQV